MQTGLEMPRTSIQPLFPLDELAESRRVFRQREPRGLHYWVALDLLRLSDEGQTWITTSRRRSRQPPPKN
jgi:hypothetical protein